MYDSNKDTLRRFCTDYNNMRGIFKKSELQELTDGTWYDWFCRDTSLPSKTIKLGAKVCLLANSKKIDKDTMYVWFKNNCPMSGSLYDDIRFADRKTGENIYVVVPKSGFKIHAGKAQVFGRSNKFKEPLVEGTWADVKKFFGV